MPMQTFRLTFTLVVDAVTVKLLLVAISQSLVGLLL